MRIERVVMTGFGAFKERTCVDFTAYADAGLFLITGRTGAGKSTILDAITYALYDSIPGAEGKGSDKVRSDYCAPSDPTEVTLEFSVGEHRYQVTRSPEFERPKTRGSGTTKERARASLAIAEGDQWRVLEATQVRKVAEQIHQVVGLTAAQFRQVILLAQGQFQEFLLADTKARVELLRHLFGTERFAAHVSEFKARRDELRAHLGSSLARIETIVDSLSTRVVALDAEPAPTALADLLLWAESLAAGQLATAEQCRAAERDAEQAARSAEEAWNRAIGLAERQRRRAEALVQQADLDSQRAQLEAIRQRHATGRQAAVVAGALTQRNATVEACAEASLRLAEARAAVEAAGVSPIPGARDEAESALQALAAEASTVRAAGADLERLDAVERDVARITAERHRLHDDRASLTAQRDELTSRLTQARERIADVGQAAAALPGAQAALEAAQEAVAAHQRYTTLAATQPDLEQRAAEALKLYTEARGVHSDLLQRRLDNYAGTLALALAEGEPCQVCGSTDHPRPAVESGAVSVSAITRAAEAEEASRLELAAADADLAALLERLRDRSADGAVPLTELHDDVERASAALADLQEQISHADRAREALADGEAEVERLNQVLSDLQVRDSALAAELSGAEVSRAEAAARVAEACHGWPSLPARAEDVARRQRVLGALHSALVEAERAETARASAMAHLDALIAQTGFDSADEASAHLLPTAELDHLDDQIRAFDSAQSALTRLLCSPDFENLPADPVDPEPLAAVHRQAREAHLAAVGARAAAEELWRQTEADVHQLRTLHHDGEATQVKYDLLHELAEALNGAGSNSRKMKLETFVLAAELEKVLTAANSRLDVMTSGRYQLIHSDAAGRGSSGLDLVVADAHTGADRAPSSLSGGEKFQASLALALGLADVVTAEAGGVRLDTLFIDEGFGSLDAETLDVTMATLDDLREGGRTLGLISHVESMKERITSHLVVSPGPQGWSQIVA